MVLEELPDGIRTIDLKPILCACEFLQKTHVVKCSTDEEQLLVVVLTCLTAKLIRPKEHAMRMIEQQLRTELMKESGRFASQLRIGNSRLNMLELLLGRRDGQNYLRLSKRGSHV